jgi:hypothetical protein
MEKNWKLLYKALRRVADMTGILLFIAALLFALRG